jgi:HD superfamily phosphohydrolase YqeK
MVSKAFTRPIVVENVNNGRIDRLPSVAMAALFKAAANDVAVVKVVDVTGTSHDRVIVSSIFSRNRKLMVDVEITTSASIVVLSGCLHTAVALAIMENAGVITNTSVYLAIRISLMDTVRAPVL